MATVHLVDGTFELYRAHFAKRPERAGAADPKAVRGVVDSLRALVRHEEVTHLAVAFDNPIRSFRNDLFAGYKSDEGVEPALRAQFDRVEARLRELGVCVWRCVEVEADDALGTAALKLAAQGHGVRVLSPDKDLGQLLREGLPIVQVDRIRKKDIQRADVHARHGVWPEQLPDYLALVGDSADGFPGLAGFGAKTAAALLQVFGSLDAIPDDASRWPSLRGRDALAERLRAERPQAELYRRLATLRDDADVVGELDSLTLAESAPLRHLEKA